MSNIFKFQTKRQVNLLTKAQVDSIGINTHPSNIQSAWYTILEKYCQSKDYPSLIKYLLQYLKDSAAIYSYSQLNEDAKTIVEWVKNKEGIYTENDKAALFEICDLRKYKDFFQEKKSKNSKEDVLVFSQYQREWQRVADTTLVLAILGKLGDKDNIDYVLILKTLKLIKLLFDKKKKLTLAEIVALFDQPIMLPHCFFRLNPCSKKIEPTDMEFPFSHLGVFDEMQYEVFDETKEDIANDDISDDGTTNPKSPSNDKDCRCKDTDPNCDCDCECSCDETCKDQNLCCAEIRPFITDLMVVREELKCYEAKHLAYIETIMFGETRERVHRHLERTEEYNEQETTISKSEEKDHQVSERYSLQTESQKTIESDLAIEAGVTANVWGPTYDATTSLNVNSQNSKSESQRIAREQAVEITERSVRKLQETVRELTSKKRIIETEETNTHSFDNTNGGIKHINGMYQFVNSQYKGQVMNYGKRLMFEFVLPEPMEMYKHLMGKQIDPFDLTEPEKPVERPQDITDNGSSSNFYLTLADKYGISDLPNPPQQEVALSFNITNDVALKDPDDYSSAQMLFVGTIPTGYTASSIHTDFWAKSYSGNAAEAVLFFQNHHLNTGNDNMNVSFSEGQEVRGTLLHDNTCAVGGSGVIYCQRMSAYFEAWQLAIYEKIMIKYEEELNEYKAALARYNVAKEQKMKFGRNPFLNREIERTELKRMAISYISCQFYDQFSAMKRNVKPCGYPQTDLEQAQEDGKFIQFFEQLFDWNLMTYLFYQYFWSDKCTWAEKIQSDSGDPLFDKALMAGAARCQVPVRSGHEALAMHWITFGEIWQGSSQPPLPGSSYYVSMAQEIKEQKGIFFADRAGELQVWNGQDIVQLTGSAYYWDFGTNAVDQLKIDNDVDREIIIDCIIYRIVAINHVATDPSNETWKIQLERVYEGADATNLKWSTGALFVGAPFMITVPTNLVYLRNTKDASGNYQSADCLPCFPQAKCE